MATLVREGRINIEVFDGVFYNPHMRPCRDIFTELFAMYKPSSLVDAFAATGVRGLRYMIEGNPQAEAYFVDSSPRAIENVKHNLKRLGLSARVIWARAERVLPLLSVDWVEIDPFGTAAPYFAFAMAAMRRRGFLSITTTDLPALCGVEPQAAMRYYHARPLHTRLCHETGLRLFLASLIKEGWRYGLSLTPVFSFYRRHYFKVLLKNTGGPRDFEFTKIRSGYYCERCGYFSWEWNQCPVCGRSMKEFGPIWTGPLFREPLPAAFSDEASAGPYYYDLHLLASRHGFRPPKIKAVIEELRTQGFSAARSHIASSAIRTNADIKAVLQACTNPQSRS